MASFEPAPPGIVLEVATVNGSGAKAGTWSAVVAEDNSAVTVFFGDFVALAGGVEARKNAQMSLKVLNVPPGHTFAVGQTDFRGALDLPAGVTAEQLARCYYQGSSTTRTLSDHLVEPLPGGSWLTADEVAEADLFWRPCGSVVNININAELRIHGRPGWVSMDSMTFSNFRWKRCS